jgi:heparosan-N-sulfate-glucuronate 5-epimerase
MAGTALANPRGALQRMSKEFQASPIRHSSIPDTETRAAMFGPMATRGSTTAGFFSDSRRLALPLGPAVDSDAVHGYPIDLRAKARVIRASATFRGFYVPMAQYGLGCYERWLAGDGEGWLKCALDTAMFLISQQEPDGAWLHAKPFPHTFALRAPWVCAMAQGEAASLLVRAYSQTGEEAYAQAARRAVAPLMRSTAEGGVCAELGDGLWPEEFPASPPALVLNGAIFAWWGLRDVAVGLDDATALEAFESGVDTLARNLHRFDTGAWSLYCLRRFPVSPVASSFYHQLHIDQLAAMNLLSPRSEFEATRERWIGYRESASRRWNAMARKVIFRLLVPRNELLAFRLPWTRP